jgi:predicted NBD/HSP70 family sugar kinase
LDEAGEIRDFFISYTQADSAWAEWLAWELEAAGYTTLLQAWDIPPGTAFAHVMNQATRNSRHTLLVLSHASLRSAMTEAEWRTAFVADPSGVARLLVPVRVEPCDVHGLLADRVYIDLVDTDEATARARLLKGIAAALRGHDRPDTRPRFPRAIEWVPPALHLGCRIGRRRLECGVLEVMEPTSGVPTSQDDVRHWNVTLEGPRLDGALLTQADQGLFKRDDLYDKLIASIAAFFQAAQSKGVPIASIGLAIPGGVYPDRGTFDLPVEAVPFRAGEDITWEVATGLVEQLGTQTLDQVFGTSDPHAMRAKIHLDNDARCAARWLLVEYGPSWKDFVCIFAGSGLGSGLVFNREVFYGHHFRAGEVGHVNLNLSSELLLEGTGGKSLKARDCSCGKLGYHFESLVSIGGLGHLAEVFDKDKLTQIRDAYTADPSRSEDLASSSTDDADADGMVVLRALASLAKPVPQMPAALRAFVDDLLDTAFLDLIRSKPIHNYLTLVVRQYARLFGTGIAALLDALDVDHIALCGTIPEFLQYNREFVTALYASLPENIPGTPRAVSLEYGGMRRWGWRGAALLPRDPGYLMRRRPLNVAVGGGKASQ